MKRSTKKAKTSAKNKTASRKKKTEKPEGEIPGLIGFEQPISYMGPPPAIVQIYKKSGYDNDFHPQDLLAHMRNGKTKSEIVAGWGITYTKFEEWIESYPDFAECYAVGVPAFNAYYKQTLRFVSFGQMPKAKENSLHMMIKNFAGFDDGGGQHEYPDGQQSGLEFVDDED